MLLPKPTPGDINRYLVVNQVLVNQIPVTVASIHLEWFGDPGVQTKAVVEHFKGHKGPVVIAGDFNLEGNGWNEGTRSTGVCYGAVEHKTEEDCETHGQTWNVTAENAWDVMVADGWQTVTPFRCGGAGGDTGPRCVSNYTTAIVGESSCALPCAGYQLDWILFKPGQNQELKFKEGSVVTDLGLVDDKDTDGPWCSDHGMLVATFVV